MSKARTLANLMSDNAELADGQISVAEVVGAAPLASPTFTGTTTGTFSGPLTGNVTGNITGAVTGNVTGSVTGDVTAPEIDLTAIAKDIADTAVDVFVYDTSKDSDGGAWRHRTQHTSWYNEAASATRGSRKEFPAVAVIVLEAREITIYDGDDPDMPMWMVFTIGTSGSTNSKLLGYEGSSGFTAITALNGILSFGDTFSVIGVFKVVNFISDSAFAYNATSSYYASYPLMSGNWITGIGSRNTHGGYSGSAVTPTIVNADINDVDMTVLPNAPIDYATGLPVPTIAVATDGGVSIIKDDGSVVDINDTLGGTRPTDHLVIRGNDITIYNRNNGTVQQFFDALNLSADNTNDCKYNYTINGGGGGTENVTAILRETLGGSVLVGGGETYRDLNVANADGLSKIHDGYDREFSAGSFSIFDSSVAYITSDYNTGWMNGDIKLATLSDTDTTNVVGGDLNTDPNFDSGVGIFIAATGSVTHSSGTITSTKNSGSNSAMTSSAVLTVGKTYCIEFQITAISGNTHIDSPIGEITSGQVGTHSGTFVATGTTVNFGQNNGGSTSSVTFTKICIYLAEEDRSVNGNGVKVYGTVAKTAVATGADLVGYGPFSNANYLLQPYNSDLDFGTGDFCVMGWFKMDSNNSSTRLIYRQQDTSNRWTIYSNTQELWFYQTDGTATYSQMSGSHTLGSWNHFVLRRTNSLTDFAFNGKVRANTSGHPGTGGSRDVTFNGPLYLGKDPNQSSGTAGSVLGSLALIRISATIPSPEQIAKIYNDEKHLFQENAQATLHGTSDAVTALAHDDSTDLLHVGTSAGRSVFQGLRRVENTTDAVGATISASNGLVAED